MSGHGHHEVKEPVGWMDRPDTVKRLFMIFYAICAVLFLSEFILMGTENAHPHPLEEGMRFFVYPVYGFISFWFLVLLARPMRTLLIRSEDYYEGGGVYDPAADPGHVSTHGHADGHGSTGGAGAGSGDHANGGAD
ncbi:MAG: hypothetical protein ACPHO4_09060 [Longimicrobiales bacterium]